MIGHDLFCLKCTGLSVLSKIPLANFIEYRMGWGMTLTFLPWGKRFQMHRKLIQGSFTKPNCVQYQDLQESETHQLVAGIMRKPDDWERQMRRSSKSHRQESQPP